MKNVLTRLNNNNPNTSDEVLKLTTLVYLEDALRKEEYEQCAELIRIAKGFGARQNDISGVLRSYNRTVKDRAVDAKKGTSPRF